MFRSKGLAFVLFGTALVLLDSNIKAESSKAEGVMWSPAAALCATPSLAAAKPSRPGGPNPGTLSVCVAQCALGTVTCTGTSCSATDRNCPSTQGFCWSNTEGYKYCSPCPSGPVCTAECAYGPDVTCTGTSSCSATDSDCPSQVGFCWSDAEGYKYCQACEVEEEGCTAQTYCGSTPLSCQGNVGTCSVSQGCWVQCDGIRTYCPGADENCQEN
jgi:hypothetical protein